ncbi:SxtJ family membrane protein [Candidatus Marithrix sp. Canyon 246]|uniref:SxtJ family membrane protein n=1 Tax=Candidatus Marithrix sp. Canyon 246 TaxID=1827136 RepID=UPI000849FB30|nr:SxtJ family membrane protein [Candidatus Marithrix sp. Canyon 246]
MHIEIPDKKGLRDFGLITGGLFVAIFGLLLPWLLNLDMPVWPFILAGVLWILALLIPNSLKPIYTVWMFIGLILGWINTRIILALVFYIIITPIRLIMLLFAGKTFSQKKPKRSQTFRNISEVRSPKHMEKPF